MNDVQRYVETTADAGPEASRVLTTLLFTDIVGLHPVGRGSRATGSGWGTARAASRERPGALRRVRRPSEVDCAGDGFFATFDTATSAIR